MRELLAETAALTGESMPRDAKTGDEVISGCINMTGVLKIKTSKEFGESTVSKILDLVENASSRKSKSRTLSPVLPASIPRQSAMRPWPWQFFRRWFRCSVWDWLLHGRHGFTVP